MADSLADPKDPAYSIDSVIDQHNASGVPDHRSSHVFAVFGALYLFLLSLPLIAFPRFLVLLLGPSMLGSEIRQEEQEAGKAFTLRTLNGLELYLSRLVGLSFITLAIILILQSGAIPLTSSLASSGANTRDPAPYRQPTVFFVTLFFGLLGFVSWNVGMKMVGLSGSGLAAWGLYVFLFAVGDSRSKHEVIKKKSK